ncbi:MAG: hypothetical protein WDN50_01010 [Bradyrhizobium sp.]
MRGLGILDRGVGIGPGETDFEFGERHAVDDDGFQIRAPDLGVPEASSGLERHNEKAVIDHVMDSADSGNQRRPCGRQNDCELVHISRGIFIPRALSVLIESEPGSSLLF